MNLRGETVGAAGGSGEGYGEDEGAKAVAVRRSDEDRQVGLRLGIGHRSEVERVAGRRREGAYAALAEDDLVVAFGEDIFGGEQQIFDARRKAEIGRASCRDRVCQDV